MKGARAKHIIIIYKKVRSKSEVREEVAHIQTRRTDIEAARVQTVARVRIQQAIREYQQNFNRNRFLLVRDKKSSQITPEMSDNAVNRSRCSRKRRKITVLAPFTYLVPRHVITLKIKYDCCIGEVDLHSSLGFCQYWSTIDVKVSQFFLRIINHQL
jgi:hypothetical protein